MKSRTNPISSGGAFLTQKGEKIAEVKNEITELEQLLAAAGQTSQSTLLLKKKKEMREVDDSLELMKKDYKKRMDDCEERRVLFESKQAKMREQVLKFEKFIQENDAKRQRAEAKAKQEKKLYDDKIKEIAFLTGKIQTLEFEQQNLAKELVSKSCYKDYLERIVEERDAHGYEEVAEVLNRHFTLQEANKDLVRNSHDLEHEVDEFRRKLQQLTTEKQNQLLVSTSILQANQSELEKRKSAVKQEEEEKLQREDKTKDISRELSQITQAIRNLFGRCFSTMRIKPVFAGQKETAKIEDVLDYELDIIHIRIEDLLAICEEYKTELHSAASTHVNNNLPLPPARGIGGLDLKENSVATVVSNGTSNNQQGMQQGSVNTSTGGGKGHHGHK